MPVKKASPPAARAAATKSSGPVRRRRVITSEVAPTLSITEMRDRKREEDKARFILLLDKHLGIISYACADSGIPRRTVYQWMDEDPEFQRKVKEVDHKQVDFVERKLLENIRTNDTRAITFYLSTKGRNRGYTTRVELMTPPGEAIRSEVKVDHAEARDEMGDKALGKALKAALRANPAAFTEATRIAVANGATDRA